MVASQTGCHVEPMYRSSSKCTRSPRPGLSAEKKVAVTLYYLKDTGSALMTSNTFGVAFPTVTVTECTVCYANSEHLLPEYIHMPKEIPSLERLIAGWDKRQCFQWLLMQWMECTSSSCNHTSTHKITILTK